MPLRDHQPALHNCGPGPMSVYRTAPAGAVHLLDLFAEIEACELLPRWVREPFVPKLAAFDRKTAQYKVLGAAPLPPEAIGPLVDEVASQLPHDESDDGHPVLRTASRVLRKHGSARSDREYTDSDAVSGIERLTRHLHRLGCLVPVSALVSWVPRSMQYGSPFVNAAVGASLPWLRPVPKGHAEMIRLAWLMCVYGHAAPPIVLFNRPVSFRFWRADGALGVRWLGDVGVSA